MGRPCRKYRRRALKGIDVSGYHPPDVVREWLRNLLLEDSKGLADQLTCKPWAVWLVWAHDEIDSKRVSLLCCVGERQALYIMDYATRLDGYLCRLYQDDSGTGDVTDISHLSEYQSVHNWAGYWRHVNGESKPMTISDEGLRKLRELIA